ncbi:hypothetical protein [Thalassospira xiamenensis]|uniref:hypothetical protein n=1 Tax=Thalassospira xiamenensis TaxID=220697 RepID=UPI003AA96850
MMDKVNRLLFGELTEALKKPPTQNLRCPVCGGEHFDIPGFSSDGEGWLNLPGIEIEYAVEGKLVFPRQDWDEPAGPMIVPVTCQSCGYILPFNSEVLARRAHER